MKAWNHAMIDVLSRHFTGVTEEDYEKTLSGRCADLDPNQVHSQYREEALSLEATSSFLSSNALINRQ